MLLKKRNNLAIDDRQDTVTVIINFVRGIDI